MKLQWFGFFFLASIFLAWANEPWQDSTVFEIGRLPMRAQTFPKETILLDGTWDFAWYAEPSLCPNDWNAKWTSINVPSCWEMRGFGTPLYSNIKYPFAAKPPRVMDTPPSSYTTYKERNPTGLYRRQFSIPNAWSKKRVILNFQGVSSAFYVRVNGRDVGYAEDSRLPSEFDITDVIQSGVNTLSVKVLKYSDGSYLEDQDFWRLAGIFRSVRLFAIDTPAIWDIQHGAALNGDCSRATIAPTVLLYGPSSTPYHISYTFDGVSDSQAVSTTNLWTTVTFPQKEISSPKLWSAESPNLTTLTVNDRSIQVGFRKTELRGFDFTVNGKAIKIIGINRHEMSPRNGYTLSHEEIDRDLKMIKEAGFNFIRTAHYPNDLYFYEACDRIGLYVMDEANIESHELSYHKRVLPGDKPEWTQATLARGERMVIRDRNYACVLMWSLGNEAGYGDNFMKLRHTVRDADPEKRLIHYADMNLAADMDSQTYPTPDWLRDHLKGKAKRAGEHGERSSVDQHGPYPSGKPFLLNEYAHAMGNSLGGYAEYWDLIRANPMLMGGFIWDWADQALWQKMADGTERLAYGGDYNDRPNNKNFCCNGIVSAERIPHPSYYEAQAVNLNKKLSPVSKTAVTTAVTKGTKAKVSIKPWFWRAPTDNDQGWGMQNRCAIWRKASYNIKALPKGVTFTCNTETDGDATIVHAKLTIAPGISLPQIPRVGLLLVADQPADSVSWTGLGPYENYLDRQTCVQQGSYTLPLAQFQTDYVRPQANGNRGEVSSVTFSNGLKVESLGKPFGLEAHDYLPEDLEKATHSAELRHRQLLSVHIDAAQQGVGGDNSWGLPIHPQYILRPQGTYELHLRISGADLQAYEAKQ